jgi:hypothetical protein
MARRRTGVLLTMGAFLVLAAGVADALPGPVTSVPAGAAASAVASPVELPFDAVTVFQTGELTAPVRDATLAAANSVNAPASVGRGFTALMTKLVRGATVVQKASAAGWAFPMAVTALPLEAIGPVMGRDVAAVLAQGQVVMGQTSAGLRGAQVGDLVDLIGQAGSTVSFVIGRIGTDVEVGGTEFVMSTTMADRLGATIATRVLVYGQFNREALVAALAAGGIYANRKVRVRTTWDASDPDSSLGMAATKSLLGEFDFNYAGLSTTGWTAMSPTWRAQYLPSSRETYPTGIKAMCNRTVKADLRAALQEVVDSGLAWAIDVANANSAGGCATGSVRFARITQALGSVSRHSWGQPLDTNTTSNCQGCVPKMDCRVVRIFRKHGFAWGGNFLTPDGMHFEWVGEPRNALQYPSKYCPNLSGGRVQILGPPRVRAARSMLFSDDGLMDE